MSDNKLTGAIDVYKSMVAAVIEQELEEAKKKLDPVDDKANDKEFKDRKDKDIDNDGDVDSSDEFLHKKRAAIDNEIDGGEKPAKPKKGVNPFKKEEVEIDEARQMKDPKNDSMVTKGGKTIVIDKSKEKEYLAKGWTLSEAVDIAKKMAGKKADDGETEADAQDDEDRKEVDAPEPKSDGSEIKSNPKTADKKAEISKIKESFDAMWEDIVEMSKPKKSKQVPDSASKPEGIMDKESPKSKEFAKQHDAENPELVGDDEEGHDAGKDASKSVKKAKENKPSSKAESYAAYINKQLS